MSDRISFDQGIGPDGLTLSLSNLGVDGNGVAVRVQLHLAVLRV